MGTIALIILGVALIAGVGAYVLSREADPKDRAKEAVGAAAGGAMMTFGCIVQLILSVLPLLLGLFFLGLLVRSCQ